MAGPLTKKTSPHLREMLTARCAGATVVGLDLRQLTLVGDESILTRTWPDGPELLHLLPPQSLRCALPYPADRRIRWHIDFSAAWRAWCGACP